MAALLWTDLIVASTAAGSSADGRIAWAAGGTAPDRTVVITYTNMAQYESPGKLASFQIEFAEGSDAFTIRYGTITSNLAALALAGTNYGDGESGSTWAIAANSGRLIRPTQ